MLRIEFSSEELNGLRLADGPDPLWETVLSLHILQTREAPLTFDPWRAAARTALARAGLTRTVEALMRLCPAASYFPDFLTPGQGGPSGSEADGLERSVEQVLSTPKRRLRSELSRLCSLVPGPVPPGARQLAEGDPEALRRLGEALRRYYATAVEPCLPAIRSAAAEDRARRADAALSAGPAGLLRSYTTEPVWHRPGSTGAEAESDGRTDAESDGRTGAESDGRSDGRTGASSGVLEAPYPTSRRLPLHGRSLTLVPSLFCVRRPVALVDESLPPVLVHPLSPRPGWCAPAARPEGETLAQLIGTSRARLLETLDRPMTTTGVAEALRVALSTASRHTAVLREAGLVHSLRQGNSVLHARTPLGEALLSGGTPTW
ncbi:ArsR/SmtB family transcription factor [Streptomyces sp. NPDC048172]|uniref:ArsR/SmtB family transcription factor n=1 Tax=Streptomyces sp. NPDC048172 TaxID=3365505 RepID=UPI00371EFAE4